jgi:hypothetical protein
VGQPTRGQAPPGSPQERAQLLGSQANPAYGPNVAPTGENQGYAVASPNERDIGEQQILKRTEEYKPFTVSIYSPFYWTSNAALVSSGEQDDVLVAPGFFFSLCADHFSPFSVNMPDGSELLCPRV